MSRPTSRSASLEPLVVTADNTIVVWRKQVLLQVRRGALDLEVLRRGNQFAEPLVSAGQAFGMLAILEPGAPLPAAELRKVQRDMIERVGRHERARVAAAMLGEDTTASLVRSSGRLLAPGNPRIQRFDAVRPAISWLAQELSAMGETVRATELYDAVESVRQIGASP